MVARLGSELSFPSPAQASKEGLLAWGGDLRVERLKAAYQQGIFPWYQEEGPILWWSPDPRCVLWPSDLYVSKTTKRFNRRYEVSFDQAFSEVVRLCANKRTTTWITPQMQAAYERLHKTGMAHSVEVYEAGQLIGGVYGVCVGGVFCGESMVSLAPNASKVALLALCTTYNKNLRLIDCQVPNAHLFSLGASTLSREKFLAILREEHHHPCGIGA